MQQNIEIYSGSFDYNTTGRKKKNEKYTNALLSWSKRLRWKVGRKMAAILNERAL